MQVDIVPDTQVCCHNFDHFPCCIETYNLIHNLTCCSFNFLGSSSALSFDILGTVNDFLGVVVNLGFELAISSELPLLCRSPQWGGSS